MGGQKPFKNRFPGAKKRARCRQNHDGLTLALRVTKFSEGDISGRKAKLTFRTQFDPSIKGDLGVKLTSAFRCGVRSEIFHR